MFKLAVHWFPSDSYHEIHGIMPHEQENFFFRSEISKPAYRFLHPEQYLYTGRMLSSHRAWLQIPSHVEDRERPLPQAENKKMRKNTQWKESTDASQWLPPTEGCRPYDFIKHEKCRHYSYASGLEVRASITKGTAASLPK